MVDLGAVKLANNFFCDPRDIGYGLQGKILGSALIGLKTAIKDSAFMATVMAGNGKSTSKR